MVVGHGLQQGQAPGAVVAEVFLRDGHALAHQGKGGEVDHRLDFLSGKDAVQKGAVGHVPFIEPPALERGPVPLGEIVGHHHIGATVQQGSDTVAADIAGAAGYKY
ncbi:hypothetical protein SDC9_132317 [bioreactor metagenome]|uniref:Uncharacterized protein n=1 Tax=bioreactor metagenome TaxID=1076179 RepID=A0A645D7P1_9ZZZZ